MSPGGRPETAVRIFRRTTISSCTGQGGGEVVERIFGRIFGGEISCRDPNVYRDWLVAVDDLQLGRGRAGLFKKRK